MHKLQVRCPTCGIIGNVEASSKKKAEAEATQIARKHEKNPPKVESRLEINPHRAQVTRMN